MKLALPLLVGLGGAAVVAACATAPDARDPRAERELAEALAGRTPGPPVRCLPNYRTDNMQIIDDRTILFRDGRTVYLQRPQGGCPGIASHRNILVTRPLGTNQLCSGDISHLLDPVSGISGGACVFGPFVPYSRPAS